MEKTPSRPDNPALSVIELTRRIKGRLDGHFRRVRVEGECSNLTPSARGHLYLTLKDAHAAISVVRFSHRDNPLPFEIANGTMLRVTGSVQVYEPRGTYQLIAEEIAPAGKGALQERFEALKRRLHAEGLFDPARKRTLPTLPRRIGLVTSPHGAAVRDVLQVLERRFPNLHVIIAPVRVQGQGAAGEIAAAVRLFNRGSTLDVLLVTRGGGSIEDLWAFNEEVVARAIADSRLPVISAVGHETDITIADFVADLRAPTPSAAAELLVGRKDEFLAAVTAGARRLRLGLQRSLLGEQRRFERLRSSFVFREPANLVRRHRERLQRHRERATALLQRSGERTRATLREHRTSLIHRTAETLRRAQQQIDESDQRLAAGMERRLETGRQRINTLAAQLRALDPHQVLERGFSITRDETGHIVKSADQIQPGDPLRTTLADGEIHSTARNPEPPPAARNDE